MTLLVSIHDVTPALRAGVETLWALCQPRGVRPALLVVPDWHGQWPLERHPDFVDWLRARADEGAEIVLHGERHDEVGLERTWWDHLRAWGRTAREGEFLTLDREAARERIARGLARLRALGLEPVGFVPPAWLAREDGLAAAGDCGLRFAEDERSVRLYPSGGRVPAPAWRWSTRRRHRAYGSALVSEGRWLFQRRASVVRLALHPPDVSHPVTARAAVRALDRLLRIHRPTRYADLAA
ncbi:MAG TPA: polysaccharide deacetylase family protein [Gemmatimonadales bacterium]|nr:polysaccharide deacetylase family protein [Gemmatimonadales bacterium]